MTAPYLALTDRFTKADWATSAAGAFVGSRVARLRIDTPARRDAPTRLAGFR